MRKSKSTETTTSPLPETPTVSPDAWQFPVLAAIPEPGIAGQGGTDGRVVENLGNVPVPYLVRKKSGIYHVRISRGRDLPPIDRSTYTRNEKEAEAILERIKSEHSRRRVVSVTQTPTQTVIETFVAHRRSEARTGSVSTELSRLRGLFGTLTQCLEERKHGRIENNKPTLLSVRNMEQITSDMISQHFNEMRKGVSAATVNRHREVLYRLFEFARLHHRYVCPEADAINPVGKVKVLRERRERPRYLQQEEIRVQLEVLSHLPRLRFAAALMILAGLRREEVTWLKTSDFNAPAGWIQVRATTDPATGERWQTKTGKDRLVPISNSLEAEARRYLQFCPVPIGCVWLVPSPRGVRWHPNNMSATLREANLLAKLRWTPLDYRHTFGSQLAQRRQWSADQISLWMGNSPDVARSHYIDLMNERERPNVEFLDGAQDPRSHRGGIGEGRARTA